MGPVVATENEEFLSGKEFSYKDLSNVLSITRKFTQIVNTATIPHLTFLTDPSSSTVANVAVFIQSTTTRSVKTNIAGFNVKLRVAQEIHHLLSTGIHIPSQRLERRYFPKSAGSNGIATNTDNALSNTTNITVMCPKRSNDCTVFENIMYQNVSLSVNKHQYPDTEVSTIGPRFYQTQLVGNDLDGTLEAMDEFEESYAQPLDDSNTGESYELCRSDGTSFDINFQLQRSNGVSIFDGIHICTRPVPVTFKGQSL